MPNRPRLQPLALIVHSPMPCRAGVSPGEPPAGARHVFGLRITRGRTSEAPGPFRVAGPEWRRCRECQPERPNAPRSVAYKRAGKYAPSRGIATSRRLRVGNTPADTVGLGRAAWHSERTRTKSNGKHERKHYSSLLVLLPTRLGRPAVAILNVPVRFTTCHTNHGTSTVLYVPVSLQVTLVPGSISMGLTSEDLEVTLAPLHLRRRVGAYSTAGQ